MRPTALARTGGPARRPATKPLRAWRAAVLLLLPLAWPSALAAQEQGDIDDLTRLSLQELMNVEVVSVSKTARKLSDSAAAVYVITSEQIRRSGANSIPELLRTVPGLQVARIDSNKWAISARGFSGRFANKLLVLIDGRSVYTPLFSGVYWDLQDTLLEDVDRIEVVRGPGATLWGANAVNGVINIITKPTSQTRGTLATLSAGAVEGAIAGLRVGGALGTGGDWRAYVKAFDRGRFTAADGTEAHDAWQMVRAGFRIDARTSAESTLQVQGDLYSGEAESTYLLASPAPPYRHRVEDAAVLRGGNLLAEYRGSLGTTSAFTLRGYYDRTDRTEILFSEVRDTIDLEAQHEIRLGAHQVLWGIGFRHTTDRIGTTFTVQVEPDERGTSLFNAFVQDDVSLLGDAVRLTFGTKVEHNDYTGWELQPNVRALWHIDDRHTLWGSVSRAVRTPARADHDGRIIVEALVPFKAPNPTPFPIFATYEGQPGFVSETLVAYELGYRARLTETVSFDVASFVNRYDSLRDTTTLDPMLGAGFLVVPTLLTNGGEATTRGVELAAEWQPELWARLQLGYSHLDMDAKSSASGAGDPDIGANPRHQFFAWIALEPAANMEADLRFRHVSEILGGSVEGYLTADARLGWRLSNGLDVALVGTNLFRDGRIEFVPEIDFLGTAARIERSVYATASWNF